MSNQMANSTNIRRNTADDTFAADDKNNNNFRKRKSSQHHHTDAAEYCGCETEVSNRSRSMDGPNDAGVKLPQQQQQSTSDVDTTKSHSGNINFSVDRILDNSSHSFYGSQMWPSYKVDSTAGSAVHVNDEFNRLCRPMPVRYLPNAANFAGAPLANAFAMPLQRTLIKPPYLNYHHIHATAAQLQANQNNFFMDKILASTSTIPFPHYANAFQRTDIDPTNPKITSIPPPSPSNLATHSTAKRKRSWSRAVFSQLQRKGLEIQFQIQKYITKPDRRKLAARLGLTDAQVKVWFQNRRMKWRHSRDTKTDKARSAKARPTDNASDNGDPAHSECSTDDETSCSSDEANSDIDVVAE